MSDLHEKVARAIHNCCEDYGDAMRAADIAINLISNALLSDEMVAQAGNAVAMLLGEGGYITNEDIAKASLTAAAAELSEIKELMQ